MEQSDNGCEWDKEREENVDNSCSKIDEFTFSWIQFGRNQKLICELFCSPKFIFFWIWIWAKLSLWERKDGDLLSDGLGKGIVRDSSGNAITKMM